MPRPAHIPSCLPAPPLPAPKTSPIPLPGHGPHRHPEKSSTVLFFLSGMRGKFSRFLEFSRFLDLMCGWLAWPLRFQGWSPVSTRAACLPGAWPHTGFHLSGSRSIFSFTDKASFCQHDLSWGTLGNRRDWREEEVSLRQSACHTSSSSQPPSPNLGALQHCQSSWRLVKRSLSLLQMAWKFTCKNSQPYPFRYHSLATWLCLWIWFSTFCLVQTFVLKLWPVQIHKYKNHKII